MTDYHPGEMWDGYIANEQGVHEVRTVLVLFLDGDNPIVSVGVAEGTGTERPGYPYVKIPRNVAGCTKDTFVYLDEANQHNVAPEDMKKRRGRLPKSSVLAVRAVLEQLGDLDLLDEFPES